MGLWAEGATAREADEALRELWKPKFDGFDEAELDAYLAQCEELEVEVDGEEFQQWEAMAEEPRRQG